MLVTTSTSAGATCRPSPSAARPERLRGRPACAMPDLAYRSDRMTDDPKPKRPQQVFSLIVEVGRKEGTALPPKATGAALLCYASGVDEAEAVRETVAILKRQTCRRSRCRALAPWKSA